MLEMTEAGTQEAEEVRLAAGPPQCLGEGNCLSKKPTVGACECAKASAGAGALRGIKGL